MLDFAGRYTIVRKNVIWKNCHFQGETPFDINEANPIYWSIWFWPPRFGSHPQKWQNTFRLDYHAWGKLMLMVISNQLLVFFKFFLDCTQHYPDKCHWMGEWCSPQTKYGKHGVQRKWFKCLSEHQNSHTWQTIYNWNPSQSDKIYFDKSLRGELQKSNKMFQGDLVLLNQ